jgi:hypothetical protein
MPLKPNTFSLSLLVGICFYLALVLVPPALKLAQVALVATPWYKVTLAAWGPWCLVVGAVGLRLVGLLLFPRRA